ncbi:MAG: pyridoxamine 5'-phosphate oxidase [Chloroflexi bacterium RBG_16_57_11]|nr:MAG: pyridoxamine 5'-phosphate oxidase [Chloroflexi bacterium RBG_16_57_11]
MFEDGGKNLIDPKVTRPQFPEGYLENPKSFLPWSHVERRLTEAMHYWLCTVRPNGRPHVVPKWAVYIQGKIYFDGSPETRHARNIAKNQHVVLHLESGEDVVIVEGLAKASGKPPFELAVQIAQALSKKYADRGYAPQPDQWNEGGLFEIEPRMVLAWTQFTDDPTRFILE